MQDNFLIRKIMNEEQISVVNEVAAQYWQQDQDQITDALLSIEIIKRTGGKIMGFFPKFKEFPPVFFKVYFYDRGFRFEVEGLKTANALASIHNIRVPRIINILPEHRAILMEKKTWQDSDSQIKRFFVNSLNINWEHIGAWLRNFHDSKITQDKNEYFIRKKFEKIASHLESLKPLFTRKQLETMDSLIISVKDYIATHSYEWVISHGDFGLDNIKISVSGLQVIDFEDSQMAPREFDIINCLTRLEYTSYFPHNSGEYYKICHEFLEGYKLHFCTTLISNFIYLLIKLDMIESYYRREKGKAGKGYKKLFYSYYEREGIKRLCQWLDRVNSGGLLND